MEIEPILDDGLVPITEAERWEWMRLCGSVTTVMRAGQLYRVLEPREMNWPGTPSATFTFYTDEQKAALAALAEQAAALPSPTRTPG